MATKVVNNLPNPCTVPFENIELGHFFLDKDGDLCIRTDTVDVPSNAFYFEGNIFIDMGANEMVTPVNVTINIDSYGK